MHSAVEIAAVISDSRSASSAASLVSSSGMRGQSARSRSPTTGSATSANAQAAGIHSQAGQRDGGRAPAPL